MLEAQRPVVTRIREPLHSDSIPHRTQQAFHLQAKSMRSAWNAALPLTKRATRTLRRHSWWGGRLAGHKQGHDRRFSVESGGSPRYDHHLRFGIWEMLVQDRVGIRRAIIIATVVASLAVGFLMLASMRRTLNLYGAPCTYSGSFGYADEGVCVLRGWMRIVRNTSVPAPTTVGPALPTRRRAWNPPTTIEFLGFSHSSRTDWLPNAGRTRQVEVKISLWVAVILLASYPVYCRCRSLPPLTPLRPAPMPEMCV